MFKRRHGPGIVRVAGCAGLLLLAGAAGLAAQVAGPPLSLDEVLFRANEAVIEYERRLSRAVAEEHTTQRLVRADGTLIEERTIVADLVLIRKPEDEAWSAFRDVLEVDGRSIRPPDGRLMALVRPGDERALAAASAISHESGEHYLQELWRVANLPTMGLTFLHALNQHRFHFEKVGEAEVDGIATWVIDFTEHSRPTFLRSAGFSLFARGTLWIDPATGRLARSRLVVGDRNTAIQSEMTVTFRHDEALGMWVPVRTRERHENPRDGTAARLEAETSYAGFRPLPADEPAGDER